MFPRIVFALFFLLSICFNTFSQFVGTTISSSSTGLTDIFMVDSSVGYAGGVDGIFKTIDGGKHWSLQPYFAAGQSSYYTNLNEIHFSFLTSNVGYAVGWNASGNFEEIIKTGDGGSTWQVQHYFNPNTQPFQTTERRLRDISTMNSSTAVAVGYMGRILKTTDGTNWSSKITGTTKDLEAVSFLNDNVGLAAGNGIVLTTADGGETWTSTSVNYQILDVAYLSVNQIIAVTSSGAILQSADGGITWTPNSFQYTGSLNKISFVDSQIGFIVSDGIIFKTIDGGNHFEKFYLKYSNGVGIPISSVDALAENRIYMVTARGELYSVFDQTVSFIPIAGFISSKTTTCDNSGQPISFTNQGRNDYQYQWLIDKAAVTTTYNFSNEFTSGGNHTVSLVAYNGVARDTSSQVIYVLSILPITKEIMLGGSGPDTLELKSQQSYNTIVIYNLQEGATYQVFRNGVAITTKMLAQYVNTNTYLQFQVPDVPVGGTYDFLVKAELTSTCGVATKQKSFRRFILDVPLRPTNLKGTNSVNNGAGLTWMLQSTQTTYYQIERRAENESQFSKIGTVNLYSPLPSYSDVGPLLTNVRYYYRVAAGNSSGLSQYSNVVSVFMHGDIIYVNPNATGANNGSSWNDALKDIYQAFSESTLDDEVWVMKGTYTPDPSKQWIVTGTRGVFGGFNGTETSRDQRNWKLNKTVFSGEIGTPGLADNIYGVINIMKGNLSGVTVRGGMGYGASVIGNISDCIIEFNNTGAGATNFDKCIIRNNNVGSNVAGQTAFPGYCSITNSFVYNNTSYGINAYEADVDIANCIFYANKLGSLKAYYYNQYPIGDVNINIYSSVFGYSEGDKIFDFYKANVSTYESTIGKDTNGGGWSINFVNYRMNYMYGDDGILGTDDDLLYFPEPDFKNAGRIRSSFDFPYFGKLDKDFFYNPRVRDDTLDVGPAEFLPDTIKVPNVKVTKNSGTVTINWPKLQSGVTRIWLERRESYNEVVFISVSSAVNSYVDTGVAPFKEYSYSIRLQKGSVVSFPGLKVKTNTNANATLSASPLNNFINSIQYSYLYSYPPASMINMAYLEASTGTPNDFRSIQSITLSNQTAVYYDYAPNLDRYYRIFTYFNMGNGVFIPTYSDTVFVAAVANQTPTITGQTTSSIIQGDSFVLTSDLLQAHDDYNFPLGISMQVLSGDHYSVANNYTIVPDINFTGNLLVNVTVSDSEKTSDVYQFILEVKPNQKPLILGQAQIKIVQGSSYTIQLADLTVSDDYSFPKGALLEVLPDSAYTINDNYTISTPNTFSGTVEVLIHVSDGFQYSDIFKFKIFVDPTILADFTADKTNITAGDTVDFVSTISGSPATLLWEFEGATPDTSNDPNPIGIIYATPGKYKVQLTLTDDIQNVSKVKNSYIIVNTVTAIEETKTETSLYPNPNSGEFYISSKGKVLNFESISVTDMIGKNSEAFTTLVDTSTAKLKLPQGEYIVSFSAEGTWFHKKVIIY